MPTKKTAAKKTATKTAAATPVAAKSAAPKAAPKAAKKAAPKAPAAVPAASVVAAESAVAAHQETFETVMKAGTQAASKGYEQMVAITQEQVEKASDTIFKRYDEAASLGQENIDAYVKSGTAFAQGVESLSKELMSFAQFAMEANVANAKAMFGVTTLRELIDLQSDFQRTRFDSLIAESAKLTELSMALANDAFEPIQLRFNANVEKFFTPLAA